MWEHSRCRGCCGFVLRRVQRKPASEPHSFWSGCGADAATWIRTIPSRRRVRVSWAVLDDRDPDAGLWFSELLPRQAAIADKFAVLRSMAHTGGGHPVGLAATALRRSRRAGQADAGLSRPHDAWPTTCDRARPARCPTTSASIRSRATTTSRSPGRPTWGRRMSRSRSWAIRVARFEVPNIGLADATETRSSAGAGRPAQVVRRAAARDRPLRRDAGRWTSSRPGAVDLLTSPEAARAFDLSREDPEVPRPLRPQRLGPAMPDGPPAGRGGRRDRDHQPSTVRCAAASHNWDDHAVNHHVFDATDSSARRTSIRRSRP